MAWDIERGSSNEFEPHLWQTDTCIGGCHYDRTLYKRNGYKSTKTVIQMLADVVSKNANLLLKTPVRDDGRIDENERKIVEGIADWMDVNREYIFGTRSWKVFGEGPASSGAKLTAQGFNEGRGKPFSARDVGFTQKGNVLYAIVLGWPTNEVRIRSLGKSAQLRGPQSIKKIQLLGSKEKVQWDQPDEALLVPQLVNETNNFGVAIKIALRGT